MHFSYSAISFQRALAEQNPIRSHAKSRRRLNLQVKRVDRGMLVFSESCWVKPVTFGALSTIEKILTRTDFIVFVVLVWAADVAGDRSWGKRRSN